MADLRRCRPDRDKEVEKAIFGAMVVVVGEMIYQMPSILESLCIETVIIYTSQRSINVRSKELKREMRSHETETTSARSCLMVNVSIEIRPIS